MNPSPTLDCSWEIARGSIEVQIPGKGIYPLDILLFLQKPLADDVGIESILELGEIRLEVALPNLFKKLGNETD
jgi:hypothetical protein